MTYPATLNETNPDESTIARGRRRTVEALDALEAALRDVESAAEEARRELDDAVDEYDRADFAVSDVMIDGDWIVVPYDYSDRLNRIRARFEEATR